MCDQRRFWHLFVSACHVVFLSSLCTTVLCVSLLGLVEEETSWLAAVAMVVGTAGESDARQWSAKYGTRLN